MSLKSSYCKFFANNEKSRSFLPLSLRESVSILSIPVCHIKVHKSHTFFTPGMSDFDKRYFAELIFFFLFFEHVMCFAVGHGVMA